MKKFCMVLAVCLLLCLLPARVNAVDMQIPGKSALLMDIATGTVLYEQNSHEKLAPASVTKVMTMLLIMEAIDSGKISWSDTVTTSETAASAASVSCCRTTSASALPVWSVSSASV